MSWMDEVSIDIITGLLRLKVFHLFPDTIQTTLLFHRSCIIFPYNCSTLTVGDVKPKENTSVIYVVDYQTVIMFYHLIIIIRLNVSRGRVKTTSSLPSLPGPPFLKTNSTTLNNLLWSPISVLFRKVKQFELLQIQLGISKG